MNAPSSNRAIDDIPSVNSAYETVPAATDPVRLRTLTLIRWVAIGGQVMALLVVHFGFGFPVPLAPAFSVVGASLLLNLIVMSGHPTPVRLGERAAAGFLAFDIMQRKKLRGGNSAV